MLCRVIAATVLLLSSNFVHGQFEPSADLIVTNGRVIALDSVSTVAEAVAIRAGKIIYVGSYAEAQKLAGHKLGWQCSTHVTGDAGVDAVLDAIEAANSDGPFRIDGSP